MSYQQTKRFKQGFDKFNSLLGENFVIIGNYINTKTVVLLKCQKHNKTFNANPSWCSSYGYIPGCESCIKNRRSEVQLSNQTKDKFFKLLKGFKKLSKYVNSNHPIKLKCLKHNICFNTNPWSCIRKHKIIGCRLCKLGALQKSKTKKYFDNLLDGFKQLSPYINTMTPIKLKCLKHGAIFFANPNQCVQRQRISGCKACRREKHISSTKERFLSLIPSHIILKDDYFGRQSGRNIKAYCKQHKKYFTISPDSVLICNGLAGCSKCKSISIGEREILSYVEKLLGKSEVEHGKILHDSKSVLKPDIVIPNLKIIIEHNGLFYNHTAVAGSEKDDKWKHFNRRKNFEALGYRLIQIWGDSWIKRKPAIKRYLKAQLCGDKLPTHYARKLEVKKVSLKFANRFMNKYHPQGQSYGNHYCIGLFDSELKKTIAVMTFSETSRPVLNKVDTAELTRYASKGRVNGGASRLLSHYIKQNSHIKQIISFSDNDLFEGKMYEAIGFRYDGEDPPTYCTVWSGERRHKSYTKRSNLRKLQKQGKLIFKENWSEIDCLYFNNIRICWNSGRKRWVYDIFPNKP